MAETGFRATASGAALQGKGEQAADVLDAGFTDVVGAARFLALSRSKIYSLMDRGELPYAKMGKSRRIPKRALVEYAKRCLVAAE
jgi:excisionase family DNA binding protein